MRPITLIGLFFLFIGPSLAGPIEISHPFDTRKANQQFDHINLQLSVQNLNLHNLTLAVATLSELTLKADQCVESLQKKSDNLELLIKQGTVVKETSHEGADRLYLDHQQKEIADKQAQCRLFSIRVKEAIDAYKTAISQLQQEQALTRDLPIWAMVDQALQAPAETTLLTALFTTLPNAIPSLWFWISTLLIAACCSSLITTQLRKNRLIRHQLRMNQSNTTQWIVQTLFFTTSALLVDLLLTTNMPTLHHLPIALSAILFTYFLSLLGLLILFKIKKIRAFLYWYSLNLAFSQSFCITLISVYALGLIGHELGQYFLPNSPLWQLLQSLFVILILAMGAYFIRYFCRAHRHFLFIKHHHQAIQRLVFLLLSITAALNILGYLALAHYLTFSGYITFTLIFLTVLLIQGINKLYLMLQLQPTTKATIIRYFGYKAEQPFTEFLILKTVAQLLVIATSLYFIGQSWGFATESISSFYDQLLHGIHFLNMTLYPTRILAGVVVFCLLYLLFRTLSTGISRHQQFENEEETQVAVASILTYVGFTVALLSGFLVAGFDFTGLAIIAGALSVGIGLGLQSIVNNFVSGIILLIEKPIRPGDRINVDGVEGFVKKIRVRSTQLITPSREDIIVPNSDLITRRVTNYMFSDSYCRIECQVGVAYGSDTQLVRDVLLAVANEHEEIIKSGRNKPMVLFRSFADSALVFLLGCLIKDVNKKALVQSDLNFAIEKAFREHQIVMPFPQREIHLTNLVPTNPG